MGWWTLHSTDSNLLWELDLRHERGHVAQGSGCLSAGAANFLPVWKATAQAPSTAAMPASYPCR
jgi:hypothetical protein